MQIGAVKRQIGRAITPLGLIAEGDGGEAASRRAVEQPDRFRPEGRRHDRVEDAERAQVARGIRSELKPGATFLGEGRAFEDGRIETSAGEGEARGKPANPAAGDKDRPMLRHRMCFAIRRLRQAAGAPGGAVATYTQPPGSVSVALRPSSNS